MDTIIELFKQDFSSVLLGIFIIMSGIIAIYEIICRFFSILGKPIGAMKERKADHELLLKTVKETKNSIANSEMIKSELNDLKRIVIDKNIEDWRWEILDFSSALSNGRVYNRESFNHVFKIYKKYEKILKENDMENGLVEESIKFIKEEYNERLKNGEIN